MLGQLLRFVLKLLLVALGLVFAVSLLAAALVMVVVSLLKSLITGKKLAPAVVFGRFQKFAPSAMWPGAAPRDAAGQSPAAGQVVDVEAREIPQLKGDKQLP